METTTTPQQGPVDIGDVLDAVPARDEGGAMRFPELVLAHYRYFVLHSRLVGSEGVLPPGLGPVGVDGRQPQNGERPSKQTVSEAKRAYEEALQVFEAAEGTVQSAYWCVAVPSAVALTVRKRRGLRALFRREPVMRLHRATDWLTASYKDIQVLLHHCDILAIKAAGVLRGTAKQVALEWIFSEEQLLLAAAETKARSDPARNGAKLPAAGAHRKKPGPEAVDESRHLAAVLDEAKEDICRIERYYDRAANKAARITYFWGMVIGFAVALGLLALVALIVDASFRPVDLDDPARQNFFVAYAAGAVGAVVSVLVRMKREDGFQLDYEVGRTQSLRLGSFRPFIGAVFGLVVYFAIESDLLQLAVPDQNPATGASEASFYFLALLAFVAGFSERFTHVVIGGAERSLTGPLAEEDRERARSERPEGGSTTPRAPRRGDPSTASKLPE
jgi:hypothetical protein